MSAPRKAAVRRTLAQTAVIALFVVAYLVTAFLTIESTPRVVPVLAGVVTLALLALDLIRSLGRRGAQHAADTGERDSAPLARELGALLSVAGGVAGIYLLGFLIAVPLYLFASIAWLGRQSVRGALLASLIASLGIWLVFEVGLDYELFPGIAWR